MANAASIKASYFVPEAILATNSEVVLRQLGRMDPDHIMLEGAGDELVNLLRQKFDPRVVIEAVARGTFPPAEAGIVA